MSNILDLRKFVAPETIFGAGARLMVARYIRNLGGHHAFIVTDPGVIAAGWVNDVIDALYKAGIDTTLYDKVSPNPRDHEIADGALAFQNAGCDIIVAVGGGSPMDCAKGVGIVVGNQRDIGSFEGVDQVDMPGPPLICIPTTAGTAADLSQFAIVSNQAEHRKFAIISKTVVPDVSLIDPETNVTMDHHLTSCTGVDALVHAIEAFVSLASSPITDTHALTAMELITNNLPKVLANPGDVETRAQVTLGCMHAGMAFSNASLGAVHAMAHSLGGLLDLPHGECNAILLRHVVEFNSNTATDRYAKIGEKIGVPLAGLSTEGKTRALLKRIEELTLSVGIKDTLGIKGVKTVDIPDLATNALNDPCMVTNPRQPNKRDIEVVFEEAL